MSANRSGAKEQPFQACSALCSLPWARTRLASVGKVMWWPGKKPLSLLTAALPHECRPWFAPALAQPTWSSWPSLRFGSVVCQCPDAHSAEGWWRWRPTTKSPREQMASCATQWALLVIEKNCFHKLCSEGDPHEGPSWLKYSCLAGIRFHSCFSLFRASSLCYRRDVLSEHGIWSATFGEPSSKQMEVRFSKQPLQPKTEMLFS